jgi:hypothetical protein
MSDSIKPNFFIVGAPKCGTSAMYTYLERHPEIFMSGRKEPRYFGRDLRIRPEWCVLDTRAYLAMFRDAGDARAVGEATTYYLVSRDAAREIRDFNPAARIIIMLRNPVDMAFSLHREHLWNLNEDIEDFADAWDAQDDRRLGQRIPQDAHFPEGLLYGDMGDFAPQVQRYLDVFGPDQVKVVLFDDFIADTPRVYAEMLRFLRVAPDYRPSFERVNQCKPLKARFIQRLYIRHPILRKLVRACVNPRLRLKLVTDWLPRLTGSAAKAEMSPATRQRLCAHFAPCIEVLSDVLQRDLSHWLTNQARGVEPAEAPTLRISGTHALPPCRAAS